MHILVRSDGDDFAARTLSELRAEFDRMIDVLFFGSSESVSEGWEYWFAPTGSLQVIPIAGDWLEAFLAFGSEWDALIAVVTRMVPAKPVEPNRTISSPSCLQTSHASGGPPGGPLRRST